MIRQGKVWGWTKPLYFGNNTEVHEVKIKKDGYCSRHQHKHKANQFYVMSGKLKVIIWKDYGNGNELEDVTVLGEGESCVVPPGDDHRFIALEDTHALEIYYVQLDASDIQRVDHGGVFQYAEKADTGAAGKADRSHQAGGQVGQFEAAYEQCRGNYPYGVEPKRHSEK